MSFQRASFLIACAMAACVGTETGNPYEGDGAFGTDSPMGIAPQPVLESGFLSIGGIELVGAYPGESGCGTVAPVFDGPVSIDLARAQEPLALTLREGAWCEVVFSLAGDEGEPTLTLTGRLLDGATLDVQLDAPVEARLVASEPFTLTEAEGLHVILDIDRLFATASLGTAPRQAGNLVRISPSTDPERASAIAASFAPALRVVRDLNGDGVLDFAEREGPVLATGAP